jgi:transposase-like protein
MFEDRVVARGKRDEAKEQEWREVLGEYRQSGQTVRAFCRERGLNEASFYRWRQVIDRRDADATQTEASLASVVLVEDRDNESSYSGPTAIEIVLCGGTVVRVPHDSTSEQLEMVLDALERSRC